MTNKISKSTARSSDIFRIQKIESIECYYVCTDDNYAEFTNLIEALDFFMIQVEELKHEDFQHLSDEFEGIFGERPTDPDELSEYYDSSSASVILNVVSSDEVVIGVSVQIELESGAIDFSSLDVEVGESYEENLSVCVERIRKSLSE